MRTYTAIYLFFLIFMTSCAMNGQRAKAPSSAVSDSTYEVNKSSEEWKNELTDMEYYVLREAGTERAFTGDLWDNKAEGTYSCAGCGQTLFRSDEKYKSGTGWPSFYDVIDKEHVRLSTDYKLGYARTEVLCGRCGGHLGHVFEDGPRPTGLRYCINSVSLDFQKK